MSYYGPPRVPGKWRPGFLVARPLRVDLLTALVGLLVTTVLIILAYTYHHSSRAVLGLSDDLISKVGELVIGQTESYLEPAALMSELSSRLASQGALPLTDSEWPDDYAVEAIRTYPQLAMLNIGDERGNFLMTKKMPDGTIATKVIRATDDPPTVTWIYRDALGQVSRTDTSTEVDYDPRIRPWYRGAKEDRRTYWTDVYVFFTDRKPGLTAGHPVVAPDGSFLGAVGLDIELAAISGFLRAQTIGNSGVVLILDGLGQVVAHSGKAPVVVGGDGSHRLVRVDELGDPRVSDALREYSRRQGDSFSFMSGGQRYTAALTPFPPAFGKQWKLLVLVPYDEFMGPIKKAHQVTLLISVLVLLLAILIASALARSISRPIVKLTGETAKVKNLELDGEIDIRSPVLEIQMMAGALESMKTGLRAFRKYVPARLVRQLIESGEEARPGGHSRELTILFTDIEGFAAIAETEDPAELLPHLCAYLEALAQSVRAHHGTVDKFTGDGIMAFWGAPVDDDQHAVHACRAALLCLDKVRKLNQQWKAEGKPVLTTRIGVHTGQALVGNIGSSERMNYSAFGDSVNLASRLEGVNKLFGTSIVVSGATEEQARELFVFRPLGVVAVKGKAQSTPIYELLAEKGSAAAAHGQALAREFEKGLGAGRRRKWDEAVAVFEALVRQNPSDRPSQMLLDRYRGFRDDPPPGEQGEPTVRLDAK